MSTATDAFVKANQDRFLEELKEFLRIPSISTLPEHRGDIDRAAQFVADELKARASRTSRSSRPAGTRWSTPTGCTRPASRPCSAMATTTCSRADPLEVWDSPPFEPDRARRQYLCAAAPPTTKARCTCTSKPSRRCARCNGTLPVNVKFLVEGEEEVGGESIAKYVAENPEKLKADVALVSDTEMYARRHADAVHRPARPDLHGNRGDGSDARPAFGHVRRRRAQRGIRLDRTAGEGQGRATAHIQIPGIYDDVEAPAPAEKESWERLPFIEKEFLKKEVGSTKLTGEPD